MLDSLTTEPSKKPIIYSQCSDVLDCSRFTNVSLDRVFIYCTYCILYECTGTQVGLPAVPICADIIIILSRLSGLYPNLWFKRLLSWKVKGNRDVRSIKKIRYLRLFMNKIENIIVIALPSWLFLKHYPMPKFYST